MPLLGKLVVIKRNGTDGTEFPLTASCLFGRKLDCDIRIQLPQVSKEHCRIELNENKELILTNLSSVNPTRINGEALQQTERLKHGDLITIIDRSFRFEYPPAPTPKKKRLSTPVKGSAVKVLQHQQVQGTPGTAEKKKADHSATCLKDGSNLPPMDQSIGDVQSKANTDGTSSPFSDLCNMVKRDLATKPWKSSTFPNTPVSKPSAHKEEPKKASVCNNENDKSATPKSAKKRSSSGGSGEAVKTPAEVKISTPDTVKQKRRSGSVGTAVSQKTPRATPQKFTAQEAAQQIVFESPSTKGTPKSMKSRRDSASVAPATPENQETPQKTDTGSKEAEKLATRSSPRSSAGKRFQVEDVMREVVFGNESDVADNDRVASKKHKSDDLPLPAPKRKRVSFGGQLSPELFDKRLPPDSPLRRGATPGRRSLGFFQRPQSLLRRASTIGLMGVQLYEDVSDMPNNSASPKRTSSQKTPSPKTVLTPKTPSPAKKSPKKALTPKTKTSPRAPSPKNSKTPSPSSRPATPQTPKSTKRVSSGPVNTPCPSDVSLQTPTMRGRFSVSRIRTPSPVSDQDREATVPAAEEPQNRARRRSGIRASAKSALNSVVRSRRSGASLANLKVLSSWADVVKFGQAKSQAEGGAKKTAAKQKTAKQPKVEKLKTPARRLKDHTSTGHADSPATIVVGKAYLRAARHVGAAPKVVCNVALLKKDMKMDEDLTGVADIFKTPATVKRGTRKRGESPETPFTAGALAEMSGMNTPEESGEMVVSPLSVASTAKRGRFNAEAVSRLLHDDQDGSLIEKDDPSEMDQTVSSVPFSALEMQSEEDVEKEESKPLTQTPKRKPEPAECLTGVKNLLRTPKQRASPVEDLRGRLLRTPKAPKQPQEESLEGVKELLKTPKQKVTPVEDLSGIKEMMKTPKVKSSPVVCLVALRRLVKTPKDKARGEQEEDLTGVKELMKTPKIKGTPVDDYFGVERLMKTPKQKHEPVEDLTGIKEMMKTPKQKSQPGEDLSELKEVKTPKQKSVPVEDLTGIKEIKMTPKQKLAAVEDLTGVKETKTTPKQKNQLEEDLSELKEVKTPKQKSVPVEDLTGIKEMKTTPKQKLAPVEDLSGIKEMMKTPKVKSSPVVCSVALRRLVKTPKDKMEQEEDLTGVKELMKTPKIKGTPVDDSFGVKRLMKTHKQKHEPVEDLSGVKEMMKTPKQKLAPVEDLTGIKEMMKTPKQKSKPVEDLTGLKEMMKTPKQKSQPVEDDFEISTLMKTPKQSLVVESTRLVELVSEPTVETEAKSEMTASPETQDRLAASTEAAEEKTQVSDESEDKNVCPADMDDKPTTRQADPEPDIVGDIVEEPVVAAVVASVPSSASVRGRRGKVIELVEAVQSPARQSTRGRTAPAGLESPMKSPPAPTRAKRRRNADQESENSSAVPALEEPESARLQASERNGAPEPPVNESADVPKAVIEIDDQVEASAEAPVKSSVRSRRGKATKKTKQDEETNVSAPVTEQTEISSEAVADETEVPVKPNSKTRRGRAEKKETANAAQANESDAVSSQDESVLKSETEVPTKSSTRARRGRRTKKEAEDTESTSVSKETGGKSAEAVSDEAETEAPVKSDARTKRGRVTKKETPKTVQIEEAPEPTPVIESSVEIPDAESAETKSNTRSRRGRTTKTEPKKIEAADVNESSVKSIEAVAHVDPEAPVKSNTKSRGRTTKAEPPKNEVANVKESDIKSSEAGIEADGLESTELESSAETEDPVKSNTRSRRGRTAKTTKQQEEQAPANEASANEISDSVVEMPVVKPGRARRAKQVEEPPVGRSGRGAKSKPQVLEDEPSSAATEPEEPVLKPGVRGGRRTKQPDAQESEDVQERVEDKSENDADAVQQTGAPAAKAVRGKRAAVVRDEAETLVKRGRRVPAAEKPSRGRKAAPEPESEETVSATAGESESESQSAPDLSASSEPAVKKGRRRHGKKAEILAISEAEESRIEHEPEAKGSKKVNWRSDLVTPKNVEDLKPEPDAAADPPTRDRRGRAAKKQEPEKSKPSAEEAAAPARRGRAAAASEPREDETSTKSEQKRKVAEVVTESLPKRRRGKAASEEAAEVEPENDKPARGRRKGAQEPSAAPTQAEETDVSARRGTRSQKETEPDVSAPVKRSRRK